MNPEKDIEQINIELREQESWAEYDDEYYSYQDTEADRNRELEDK